MDILSFLNDIKNLLLLLSAFEIRQKIVSGIPKLNHNRIGILKKGNIFVINNLKAYRNSMNTLFKTFFLMYLTFFTLSSFSQNKIVFDENGYESVLQRSRKEHKLIFYMVYATWCPHCNKMKSEVFTDPVVADFLNKNFITAACDIEKPEADMIKKNFGVSSFPTFLFIDEKGVLLYSINGEYTPDALIAEAQNAQITEKQIPYLKKAFYNDPSNADKCLAYITTVRKGADRKSISEPAHTYLETQKDEQLVSAMNWRIIANAVTDIESREFQYVLKHSDEFAAVSSKERVNRKVTSIVTELLKPYVESLDTVNYKKQRLIAKTINRADTDLLIFNYDCSIAEKAANWKSYMDVTKEGVEKYAWNDQRLLKEIGQVYLKNITDTKGLQQAIKWIQHALVLNDTYDGNILLAQLYLKQNNKEQAIIFAKKAKQLTLALGWNSEEADQLFKQLGIK